jgi:hypothetical protein
MTDCKTFKNTQPRSNSLAISKLPTDKHHYQKKYILDLGKDHPMHVEPFERRQSGVISVLSKKSCTSLAQYSPAASKGGGSSKRKVMHKALSQMNGFVE